MAYVLLPYRVRVKLDDGSLSSGIIVEHSLLGYPGLTENHPSGDREIPDDPPTQHHHIVFLKEGSEEVEIGGETFVIMHMHNILAYIID
jgi:hypothetical protein